MISDKNKEIQSIVYNHLNLPTEIRFSGTTNGRILYLYNAVGQKINKLVEDEFQNETSVDYLSGFQYENGVLQFFPHAEGYVKVTGNIGRNGQIQFYFFNYVFNYTDHLEDGALKNSPVDYFSERARRRLAMLTYSLDPSTNVLKILEENHYYPFGLKHQNYNVDQLNFEEFPETGVEIVPIDNPMYKYKYNGKELQDELGLNMYDYGARYYNPKYSIWLSVDPLAEIMPYASPYNYCLGNPINLIDPTGMSPEDTNPPKKETTTKSPDGGKLTWNGMNYIDKGGAAVNPTEQLIEEVEVNNFSNNSTQAGNNVSYEGGYFDKSNYGKGPNPYSPSTDWRYSAAICAAPAALDLLEAGAVGASCSYLNAEVSAYVANFSWSIYFSKAATDYSMELFANNGNFGKVNYASVFTAGLGNTKLTKFLANGFSSSIQMNNNGIVVNNFDQTSINFAGGLISNTTDNTFNALQKVYGKKTNVMIQSLNYGIQTVSKTSSNYMSEKFKDKE